ncbi:HEAT repeat domain-containing protein [Capilliphycus salinus ALCB114379]|uniref:HEAT repeat domain-containing protein n=1 Tax=Capilliphycus salinus TaxID=2768948 RepID=UPI0039A76ADA
MSKNYSDLKPPVLSDEPTSSLILAQENSTAEKPKFQFPPQLPMGLILLGVGSIIVTGGAVFIIIKLIGHQGEPEAEEELPTEAKVEESSPYFSPSEKALIPPSPASPFRVEDEVEPPEISSQPPVQPVNKPAENNGYIDTPLPQNKRPEKPSVPPQVHSAETFLIADKPRLPQLDRVEQLILELQNPDPTKRSQTIWELGQQGDSRAIQPLVDLIYNSDSKQRSLILAALSEIGTRTLKPMSRALTLSLQDENAEVRKNAIRDLTRIYDLIIQMNQLLQRAADDPDLEVRETARWAADKLSRMRPLPTIRDEPPR